MKRILLLALMGLIASANTLLADDIVVNNGSFNSGSFNTNFGGSYGGGYFTPVYQPVVKRTCVVQPAYTVVRVVVPLQTVVVRPVCVQTVVVAQPVVVEDSADMIVVKSWSSCGKYFTDQSGNRWKIFRGDPVVGVNRLAVLRGEEWRGSDGVKQFFTFTVARNTWTFTPES